ncbi:hypothetical protein AAGW05_17560 [Arthrobacter sp. LAPM80]
MNLSEPANRLGHESILTTTMTYGHLVPGAHFRAAAARVRQYYSGHR